jgi:hypothetical protein
MKILLHSFVLLVSFGVAFVWSISPLESYTVEALGGLVLAYFAIAFIRKKRNPKAERFSSSSDIFILNTAIILLITITGNLYSPLFFLLYFLGFGITFIFEPATVFVFTIGVILVFLPEAMKNGSVESYIRIGSVGLISPLAYFFGREYKDRDEQETEIESMQDRSQEAAKTIAKDVEKVLQDEKDQLPEKDVEKLNEILEETETLREEKKEH